MEDRMNDDETGRGNLPPLSPVQQRVWGYIREQQQIDGFRPTIRQIQEYFHFRSKSSATAALIALERKGYLSASSALRRTPVQPVMMIPVLGTVAAGHPVVAEGLVEDWVLIPRVRDGAKYFGLRVKGDSMIDAHIDPGDLVVVREQRSADSGDIVVAVIEGEGVVKRFRRGEDAAELRSENASAGYRPIPITEDVRIVGKVVKLLRDIR